MAEAQTRPDADRVAAEHRSPTGKRKRGGNRGRGTRKQRRQLTARIRDARNHVEDSERRLIEALRALAEAERSDGIARLRLDAAWQECRVAWAECAGAEDVAIRSGLFAELAEQGRLTLHELAALLGFSTAPDPGPKYDRSAGPTPEAATPGRLHR